MIPDAFRRGDGFLVVFTGVSGLPSAGNMPMNFADLSAQAAFLEARVTAISCRIVCTSAGVMALCPGPFMLQGLVAVLCYQHAPCTEPSFPRHRSKSNQFLSRPSIILFRGRRRQVSTPRTAQHHYSRPNRKNESAPK